jgi:hypothetical protein
MGAMFDVTFRRFAQAIERRADPICANLGGAQRVAHQAPSQMRNGSVCCTTSDSQFGHD